MMLETIWANSRWDRMVCWIGGPIGLYSPSLAMVRRGGRPTLREAWTGKIFVEWEGWGR